MGSDILQQGVGGTSWVINLGWQSVSRDIWDYLQWQCYLGERRDSFHSETLFSRDLEPDTI